MTDTPPPASGSPALTPQQSAAVASVRSSCQPQLEALLKGMFDRLPTLLHQWSEGMDEEEQKPFLELVQTARRHRADIEAGFGRGLASSFAALSPQPGLAAGARNIDFSTLSLVRTEDMDVTVTVDSMVARARLQYAAQLGLLRRRYAHVLPKVEVTEANMPLDPHCSADAFKEAIAGLEVDVAEKILLLKGFQEQVLEYLGGLLDEANEIFVLAGVLPQLKVAVSPEAAKKPRPAPAKPAAAEKAPAAGGMEEVFSLLKGMLGQGGAGMPGAPVAGGQYHGGQYVGGGGIGALPAAAIGGSVAAVPLAPQQIAATAVVQAVATHELLEKLSSLQAFQPRMPLAESAEAPSVEQVRDSIRGNLRSDADTVEALQRTDEDVINLISLLFDHILGDRDLPVAMKALLARLQIPLLKVAILDKHFFNDQEHPARRLLNLLAKAGIGWSSRDPRGDALYAQIERTVLRILNEFTNDIALFDELSAEFSAFYEQQKTREEVVDKRTREAEEGRARAELARAMVQQSLNRRMAGRQLPPVAVRLLQEAWRQVLYINCLKEGTESESWKQAVKVVDALIWSVLPQPGPEWAARLQALAPKLANSVRKGLVSVNYDSPQCEALLRELEAVHASLLRGQAQAVVTVLEPGAAQAAGQVDIAELGTTAAGGASAVVLPAAEISPPPTEVLPEDSEFLVTVNRLSVGSWIEFAEAEKVERHKLVARIRSVDKLIFANRRGIKVAEMGGMKLAVDISLGRARLVEEAAFVDRALETMIGSLRAIGAQAGGTQGTSA